MQKQSKKPESEDSKRVGKQFLLIIVSFFLIIFTVDAIFVYNASKSWSGLATENGYQKGLDYNRTIKEVQKQNALGWNAKIKFDQKNNNLTVDLKDENYRKITNAKINAKITRPIREGFDFNTNLTLNTTKQHYQSNVEFPLPGLWKIEITAIKGDNIYQKTTRIVVD